MSSNQNSRQNNRSGRHSNKQNNRGRNQGGRGGGRKSPSHNQSQQPLTATCQVDSYGPDGKLRGNVKQLYDKYKAMANDCRTKDRTLSEAHGQYAHHYYTLYAEFTAAEAAQAGERKNEKMRKQQEASESQSIIVPLMDNDQAPDENSGLDDEEETAEVEQEEEKPKKSPKSKKKTSDPAPELPLDDTPEPAKTRKAKKPGKVKEDAAE